MSEKPQNDKTPADDKARSKAAQADQARPEPLQPEHPQGNAQATPPGQASEKAAKPAGNATEGKADKPVAAGKHPANKSAASKTDGKSAAQSGHGKPASGRRALLIVVILMLLLLAGAAGGGAWWLWQRLQLSEQAAASQGQQMQAALTALGNRQGHEQQQFAQQLQGLREQLDANRAALQTLREQDGRGRGDWQVAEAEYLIRIASNRLQLERDVGTALSALESADARLRETGDPALLPVRQALAGDIQALRSTARPDLPGLSLAINGMVATIDTLPLAGVSPPTGGAQGTHGSGTAQAAADKEKPVGWRQLAQGLWDTLKTLVVIRQHAKPVRPLLPPSQRYFLTENLRLMLEQARLALLNEDNTDFQQRLSAAQAWIETYFNVEAPATRGVLDTLSRLQKQDIRPALPDIANAVKAIEHYRETHRATPAASTAGGAS